MERLMPLFTENYSYRKTSVIDKKSDWTSRLCEKYHRKCAVQQYDGTRTCKVTVGAVLSFGAPAPGALF